MIARGSHLKNHFWFAPLRSINSYMPSEVTDKDSLLAVLKDLDLTAELFIEQNGKLKNAADLEVIVSGRDYGNGKRVGPYVRLLNLDSGEVIMHQGEWGGNNFYISVSGVLDVFVNDAAGEQRKIGRLSPGVCFGEMAVLEGVERNATICVPKHGKATVLQVSRPALRLLRKLPKFGEQLDQTYRSHGFARALEELSEEVRGPLDDRVIDKLRDVGRFAVYGKHHVVCQEGMPIDRIFVIKSGWVRRVRGVPLDAAARGIAVGVGESIGADFLGSGNCLGLEGARGNEKWKYTASLMARTELLEVPVSALTADPEFCEQLVAAFSGFSTADDAPPAIEAVQDVRALASAEAEIATGIIDGENLLVMDMDLCVRCGNCSLACHRVHGQSRLLRRGIHLTRPVTIGSAKTQHLLSPQVCMHCKDPECLTGCPTGSIFRDKRGQVDIDAQTCIGCFDCATQCPYDAISMVPREDNGKVEFNLFGALKQKFSLAPLVAPPAPATSDDVVAIKCNLCEHTPLNPVGSSRPAYSCEENCPTGALLRVDPLKYFTEIEGTLGVIFRDRTHIITRNIHQHDPLSTAWRMGGTALTVAVAVLTILGLLKYGFDTPVFGTWLTMRWLTGLVGLAGTAAVMTYPLRKQIYRRRAGALRYWMLAHVYLGAVAGVVLLLHAGSSTGGLLTTSLYVTFCFVLGTGIWGILSYVIAPRIMTSIEGEPLLIEDLVGRREELQGEFSDMVNKSEGWLREEIDERVKPRFGSFSFLWQQWVRRENLTTVLARSREEFKDKLTRLATPEERTLLIDAVEAAVTLRRLDSLIYLHKALHLWIPPHVLSTSLMLALMVVHIIQVVYFSVK